MTRQQLIDFIQGNIYPNGRNQITAPMVRDSVLAVVSFMGDAAELNIGSVVQNDPNVVTGGAVYNAINSALSSAIKFQGITTTPLTDGSTQQNILIDGQVYTAKRGDEVIYGGKEFLWTGSKWQQLGDEESWALKTISITGSGYLTGGGNLEQNRTIDISATVKGYIDHGESAYNALGNYATITALNAVANRVTALELRTNWDDYFGVDQDGNIYVKPNGNTPRNFSNAGGVASGGLAGGGGGGGGVDIEQMWQSLKNEAYPGHYTDVIAPAHIPDLEISKITGLTTALAGKADASALTDMATMTWVGQQGYATQTWVGQQGYITGINSTMVTNALGYTPANVTALADYLPLSAGSNHPLTDALYVHGTIISTKDSSYPDLPNEGGEIILQQHTSNAYDIHLDAFGNTFRIWADGHADFIYDAVNRKFGINTSPSSSYTMNVDGAINASTIYENGTALSSKYLPLVAGSDKPLTGALYINMPSTSQFCGVFTSGHSSISYLSLNTTATDERTNVGYLTGANWGVYGKAGFYAYVYSATYGDAGLFVSRAGIYYTDNGDDFDKYTIYHSGNLTKSVLTGLLDASGGYYLPLSGGTMSNTNVVTNLNADLLDGYNESDFFHRLDFWVSSDSHNVDDLRAGTTFCYTTHGAPTNGPIVAFNARGSSGFTWQLQADYTQNHIYSRVQNSNQGYWTSWCELYHSGNSNSTSIDWNAASLVLGGIQYMRRSGGDNRIYMTDTSSNDRLVLRYNGNIVTIGSGTYSDGGTYIYGETVRLYSGSSVNIAVYASPQGDVGIGTTSPQYKLDVVGVIYSSQGYASPGYVASGGNVASSDARLKSMVETVTYEKAKEIINSLYPKEWVWNEKHYASGKRGAGLIAQQVEDVLPFAIIEKGGYKYLNYDVLNAYEIALLQGHETRIDRLERENRELRKEIETLRTHINS